jgi:hypothetical protein
MLNKFCSWNGIVKWSRSIDPLCRILEPPSFWLCHNFVHFTRWRDQDMVTPMPQYEATAAYKEHRRKAPFILDLRCVVGFRIRSLSSFCKAKESLLPNGQNAGQVMQSIWTQRWRREKSLTGIKLLSTSTKQLLYWLRYPTSTILLIT